MAKKLTRQQVKAIKAKVLPLTPFAKMLLESQQGDARRDRFATPIWNKFSPDQKIQALNKAGVHERNEFATLIKSRADLAKLPYNELPSHAKTDLGFHFFKLNKEGRKSHG